MALALTQSGREEKCSSPVSLNCVTSNHNGLEVTRLYLRFEPQDHESGRHGT
jgi:hypothetical protein